jgi:hypothetical protein
MLAYVFWHRPAAGVASSDYEQDLTAFHRSLAHQPPSGLLGSAALRASELPWLHGGEGPGGYEDWYLLESWSAVGVLEAAAVSRGHASAHDRVARHAGGGAGAIYKRVEGEADPAAARSAVWVSRPSGQSDPTVADLLEDGMDAGESALWRRCMVLGPAPEFCLLGADPAAAGVITGAAASRLPAGWIATVAKREPVVDV